MTISAKRSGLIAFVGAVLAQAVGFPLISKIFGLGDSFQAPSWIVIVLVSGLIAWIVATQSRKNLP